MSDLEKRVEHWLESALEWLESVALAARPVEAKADAGQLGGPAALSQTDYDNLVRDAMKWRSNDEERAWLIERRQDVSGEPPRYWAGGDFLGWTTDINDAIRFARREDALRVHDRHKGPILGYCNVVEHLWIDERHKEYSQKAVEIIPTNPAPSANTEGLRAERAEADIEKLKMDAEHLQYERDEAREKIAR